MNRFHRDTQRRGAVLVWFAVLLPALLIFVGFAVDVGLIYLTRSDLQNASDTAALAAAHRLPGYSRDRQASFSEADARAAAVTFATKNLPTERHGETLDPSEIEFGQWDYAEREFLSGEWPYTAVRVRLKKTAENGNPMRLFFMTLINRHSQDLNVDSIAVAAPRLGGWMSGGLIGLERGRVTGEAYADGYDPLAGAYGPDNILDSGVTSNGPLTVDGGPYVQGLAKPGYGYGEAQVTNNAIVTGDTTERFNDVDLNFVDFPYSPSSSQHDNHQIPTGSPITLSGNQALSASGHGSATIPPGQYWLSNMRVEGHAKIQFSAPQTYEDPTIVVIDGDFNLSAQSQLIVDGPVEIYVNGNISITGQGIDNLTQKPQNLKIFSNGSSVNWAGGSDFYGWIYSPSALLDLAGGSQFFGGGAGREVLLRGNVRAHTDRTVGFWDQNDPIARLVW